ncbi:MAG: AI-2E family transporter [Solirubrobacterales bacterium]
MGANTISTRNIVRIVLIAVAIAAALYFIYLIRTVIGLMLVSVFLAIALAPAVDFLDRGKFPRWGSIIVVYLGIMASIFGLGLLLVPPIVSGVNDLADRLPDYVEDLNKNGTFREYDEKYDIVDSLRQEADKAPEAIGDAAGTLRDVTVGVFTQLVHLLTVLVLTFILLLDGRRFVQWVFRQLPPNGEERARDVVAQIHRAIGGYVLGNFAISVLAGFMTYAVLSILDIPFALPLAVVMAFFDLIPLVGATIGGILIAIVCAIVDFPTAPIVWLIVLVIYQQAENHLVQPFIYGRTVQLHPLLVIVSILIGGSLLGVLGALLAIPAGAVVQIVVRDWWIHRSPTGGDGQQVSVAGGGA